MLKKYIRAFIRIYKTKGMAKALQTSIQEVIGIRKQAMHIDTLYYYMNTFFDISNIPKASGALGSLQQADIMLLKIFDKLCEKHDLTYWLAFGTLLGAVRHKGFIPWDDDTDVQMLREDYDKVLEIVKTDMGPYGITAIVCDSRAFIKICYKQEKTGVSLDIFPVDKHYKELTCKNDEIELTKKIKRYMKIYGKYKDSGKKDIEKIKRDIIYDNKDINRSPTLFAGPEFRGGILLFQYSDIFPLKPIDFAGNLFNAPNLGLLYLEKVYGNYMEFPRQGIEQHVCGKEECSLSQCAIKHNVDMNDIIAELNKIYKVI